MSTICCPLSSFDGEIEFYHEEFATARKPHKCCECGRQINPGDRYERTAGKCEGDFWRHTTCEICAELRKHFACGGTFTITILWEDLRENFLPEMKAGGPCLEGLSAAAKERMFEEWRRWKGLA